MARLVQVLPLLAFAAAAATIVWLSAPIIMFDRVEGVEHDPNELWVAADLTGWKVKRCTIIDDTATGYIELANEDWIRADTYVIPNAGGDPYLDFVTPNENPDVEAGIGRKSFGRWVLALPTEAVRKAAGRVITRVLGVALYDCDGEQHIVPVEFGPYVVGHIR